MSCTKIEATNRRVGDPDSHVENQTNYRRRKAIEQATPPWADMVDIERMERERDKLCSEMGMEFVIAHKIPLKGQTVCGLHVGYNLQVASRSWVSIRKFRIADANRDYAKWLRDNGLTKRPEDAS